MVWTHRGREIPLAVYHGVPAGWYAHEVIAEHARLGGAHDLVVPAATEPGAPSWLPQRHAWLQYRAALYAVADGVSQGDPACIELAVRFIELRYIGSYSGFVREKLARRLCRAELTENQRRRLHDHFRALVLDGERTQEFRDYTRLWRRVATDAERDEVINAVREARGTPAAEWLTRALRRG